MEQQTKFYRNLFADTDELLRALIMCLYEEELIEIDDLARHIIFVKHAREQIDAEKRHKENIQP